MSKTTEESVKEMQSKIHKIECWNQIANSITMLSPTRKEKYTKLGVYEEIEKQVREFATKKAEQIADKSCVITETGKIEIIRFTDEERIALKIMAQKLLAKENLKQEIITPTPTPSNGTPLKAHTARKNKKDLKNVISKDEAKNSGGPIVGEKHRTATHDSLRMIVNPSENLPPPFSSIEIKDLSSDSKVATIEFLSKNMQNARATINVNELYGFEYVEG